MGGTRSRWEQLRREQLSRTLLNAELPPPRPVPAAPANGAAQEQVPQPPDLDPELDLEPEQEPAAARRVLVVAATPAVMSTPAGKKAWKKHLLEAAGKPPFDYRCGDTTIALQVHANGIETAAAQPLGRGQRNSGTQLAVDNQGNVCAAVSPTTAGI